MPIPTPRTNESEDAFVIRCMIDTTMQSEYPSTAQRFAVCMDAYNGNETDAENVNEVKQG